MKDKYIRDIVISEDFIIDYENAPQRVKKRVDDIIDMTLILGKLPKSVRPHYSKGEKGFWIGYVNQNRGAWRFLFEEIQGVVYLDRLLSHTEMDDLFRCYL